MDPSKLSEFRNRLKPLDLEDNGISDPNAIVTLEMYLPYQNPDDLQLFIESAASGNSSFLTPAQFDARFGALPATRELVSNFFTSNGYTISQTVIDASIVSVSAPVSIVDATFGVTLHDVKEPTGRLARIPDVQPVLPSAIVSDIAGVVGLDTTDTEYGRSAPPAATNAAPYDPEQTCPLNDVSPQCSPIQPIPKPSLPPVTVAPVPPPPALPIYGNCNNSAPLAPPPNYSSDLTYGTYGYAPYTYAADYDMPVQHGCGGSSAYPIAVMVPGVVLQSDLQTFWKNMAIPRTGRYIPLHQNLLPDYDADGQEDIEGTNDVETVTALAPGADVYLYGIPSYSDTDILNGFMEVVNDDTVAVVSMSFDACEVQGFTGPFSQATTEAAAAAKGAAEGISFVAASGDSGGPKYLSGCGSVTAPAAVPNVISLGGTSPDTQGNDVPFDAYRNGANYAWGQASNNPSFAPPCSTASNYFCGTGGGASVHFKTTEQFANCGIYKCVPDLALSADIFHRGYLVFNGTPLAGSNGTSFATPMFAAIQAEIDQRQGRRKGDVVQSVWRAWKVYGYSAVGSGLYPAFNDITAGNSGYAAAAGYDAASGIGTVDGWSLSSVE